MTYIGITTCIDCDKTTFLQTCKSCKFKFCTRHFYSSKKYICSECQKFKKERHPKCWNCSEAVPKKTLKPVSMAKIFNEKTYGFSFQCEPCIYWNNREPKCPDCGKRTIRNLRYKNSEGNYILYKKPRFWCPDCRKKWKIKEN